MHFPSFMKGSHEKKKKKMARMQAMKGWDRGMGALGQHDNMMQKRMSAGIGNHPIRSIKGHV